MKKFSLLLILLSLCLAFLLVLPSCDDDDDDSTTSPSATPVDVTGTWNVSGPGLGLLVLHLTQDAAGNITGTADRAITGGGYDYGDIISGSNVNNTINIHIVFDDGQHLELTGVVSDANNMSGTYSSYYDPNTVDQDAWSATRA